MKAQLERIAADDNLSRDVQEVVTKSLLQEPVLLAPAG
jgi:hypothetical protein